MKKLSIVIIFPFILWGCNKATPPKDEVRESLRTFKVSSQKVQSYVEATGTIQPDSEGGAKILSPLQGAVEKILVRIGDNVKKGAPLVSLRSSDVNDTYASYLSTTAQLRQAERIYNLNKQLFEIGAVTKNDLLASEANYEQLRVASEGLKNKLDIYGVSSQDGFQDKLLIKAPIDGYVTDIQAHIGDRFDTNTPLMTIANLDKLVVVANIYDIDMPRIKKGREVVFYTDVFPDRSFKGTVSYISAQEDSDTKTVKAYIRLSGEKDIFKQNMFLRIQIVEGETMLPTLPKTAVIYREGKFYVNLKKGEQFTLREIKPVRDISEKVMAVEGLKDGEEIAYSAIELEKP